MSHISLTYHIIWRTKWSRKTINEMHEKDLYKYIYGICKEKKCKLHRINSMPDHIHLCVEISPTIALSDFMKAVKQASSLWIKEHSDWFPAFDFWGSGYAAFTYSKRDRPFVIEYIKNQKSHHHQKTFKDEYKELMTEFGQDLSKDTFLQD